MWTVDRGVEKYDVDRGVEKYDVVTSGQGCREV